MFSVNARPCSSHFLKFYYIQFHYIHFITYTVRDLYSNQIMVQNISAQCIDTSHEQYEQQNITINKQPIVCLHARRACVCACVRNSFSISTKFSITKYHGLLSINIPHLHFHCIHITVQSFTTAGLAFHSYCIRATVQTIHNDRTRNSISFSRVYKL